MLGLSSKVSVSSERLVVVEMICGFRSKVLVILIKYPLKVSDSLLLSETMQSFSEIIILLEKLLLSDKYGLIDRQKFLLSHTILGLRLKNNIF